MQSATITPAEHLLRRLQKSEDFTTIYDVTVEKSEEHTYLYIRFSPTEYANALLASCERQRSA